MSLQQWRAIVRSLFPYSIDHSYADRLFDVMSTSSTVGGDTNGFITYQVRDIVQPETLSQKIHKFNPI